MAVHDDELRSRSQRLLTVERQLRRAIEQRDVGFAYQPVVHLASGMVLGAEALLRLGGEIGLSAVEVVAAAEHSGLMGTLGCLVFEGVHEQLDALIRDPENDYVVMFNLSATQLADDALNITLSRLANDDTIPPGRLAVEVPEVVVREQRDAFLELAERIRPRFKLGIDGFGTSYDSLTRIDGLPIGYVKLHRSLTATIGSEADSRHEIGEIIAGLRGRGLTVVALGVERQDQVTVLAELGCSMAQGFLFAGAVRAAELRELMGSGFADALI
ncbi:MAG: EAL domain-containing protein [Actinomycetota bacterium]|nr:EAL domain-containing protein [Actinomycetota bacterium]